MAMPKRERVMHLMGQGLGRLEMAERLKLTPEAVKIHMTRLYRKAGVHSLGEWLAKCGGATGRSRGAQ